MSLSAGIVGLPNVGKSTLFNAISSGKAAAENYPFCTIDPNNGIIAVPDKRLLKIAEYIPAKKTVPSFLELVDIAGIVAGSSKGEGLGNKFLGHIKNVDAIVHVVRCFEDPDIVHVNGSVDPIRDVTTIETELLLKDLDTVERGFERVSRAAKSGDKALKAQALVLERAKEELSMGHTIRSVFTSQSDKDALAELHLLTSKKVLYVANVDEDGLSNNNPHVTALKELANKENSDCVVICGKIESEIAELPEEDRVEFLSSMGLEEPVLNTLARSIYKLLGLRTFFTVGGEENKAWTISVGDTAVDAAGKIHTDFARGFIAADVYTLKDLEEYKTEVALRAAGKIRQEGRDYVVEDGDIIFFKFNV